MGDDLVGRCEECAGLCCVALPFARTADFALDKAAGDPCPNLDEDFRCGIHERLRPAGFAGCVAYDCFGAGQQVTQVTFGGRDWRSAPELAAAQHQAFRLLRQLHELRWFVADAQRVVGPTGDLAASLEQAGVELADLAAGDPHEVLALDLAGIRAGVGPLLDQVADLVRRSMVAGGGPDLLGADLLGADLRGRDLRGAQLRGACLIGADLRSADLTGASLLGVDLRGADVSGADLRNVVFLAPSQVAAARGDASTRLDPPLVHPPHWAGG